MNILIWLLAGAALGWLVSIVLHRHIPGLVLNILVGMLGALLSGVNIAPLFRISTIRGVYFNPPALLIALGGAFLLLVIVNIFSKENNIRDGVVANRWEQVSDKICTRWRKLTEEDVVTIDGNYQRFIDIVQTRYGFTQSVAEYQIQRYLRAVLVGTNRAFMFKKSG